MATQNLVGGATPGVTTSWTAYGYVESTTAANGVALPTGGNTAFNLNKPVYVTNVTVYVAGRGGTRSLRVGIGGQYSGYKNVSSASNASGSVTFSVAGIFQNGGNQTVKIDENGTSGFYFGRASTTGDCTDGNSNFGGSLSGSLTYYYVPLAPTLNTAVQSGVTQDVNLSWSAPSSDGGTAITGYDVHYSTSSSFTTYTTVSYGVVTSATISGLTYGQTYYFRVVAKNAASTAASTTSQASATKSVLMVLPGTDGWANFGTLPANNTALIERTAVPGTSIVGLHRKVTATATGGSYTTGNFGIERTIGALAVVDMPDLEIGRAYTVSGTAKLGTSGILGNIYRFAITGIGNGSSVTLSGTTAGTVPSYTFTATATSHVLQFELAESFTVTGTSPITVEDVYLYNVTVTRVAEDLTVTKGYWIQDNLFSGSLADHYDLTMKSIGGYWWVDKQNKTQFSQDLSYITPVGTFTDGKEYVGGVLTPGQSSPGELHYQDIQVGYDSSQVVNDLTVSNEGLYSPSGQNTPTEWKATWNQTNATSQTNWGTRRTELTTNLWLDSVDNLIRNPSIEIDTTDIVNGNTASCVLKKRNIMRYASVGGITTSLTIGTGLKTFSIGNTAYHAVGKRVRLYYTTTPSNYMEGVITNIVANTSITFNVDTIMGSGTYATWVLSMCSINGRDNNALMMKTTAATTAVMDPYWNSESADILVEPGETLSATTYIARVSGTTTVTAAITIRWYDEGGAFLSAANETGTTFTLSGTWYKHTVTGTAPANTAYAVIRVVFNHPSTWTVGQIFLIDSLILNRGTNTDYFDGGTTDTTSYIYDWMGEAQASQSRRSTNRLYTRATDILTKFADPAVVIKSFTWNAAENPLVAGQLDVGSLIYLKFNGVNTLYRVAGLEHEATPFEWMITVKVQKVG